MVSPYSLVFLIPSLVSVVAGQANVTGNCLTGRYTFDPLRTYALAPGAKPGSVNNPNLDPSRYDFTIDYGGPQVRFNSTAGLELQLVRSASGGPAIGVRVSTVRYMLYGRITARFRAVAVPGVITTFITMSDVKDEIDIEMVGSENRNFQSNVFFKGIEEFGVHGGKHAVPSAIDQMHTYTMDWTSTAITWSVDGTVVRTHRRDGPEGTSPMTPSGQRWFPNTPSLVQISVWDGGSSSSPGTVSWAGGPIPWNGRSTLSAFYESIDIQCYDDQNRAVERWPANSPARSDAQPAQPTAAANAADARGTGEVGLGSQGGSGSSASPMPSVSSLPTGRTGSSALSTSVGAGALALSAALSLATFFF